MNVRLLQQLFDRSGLGAYMPLNYNGHEYALEEHTLKFAELIVKECASWIEKQDCVAHPTAWLLSDELKEHFGVE